MKKLTIALLTAVFCLAVFSPHVQAKQPELFFTALQTSNQLDYAEIYNGSDAPINMGNYLVEVKIVDANNPVLAFTCTIQMTGWLRPQNHGVLAAKGIVSGDDNQLAYDGSKCLPLGFTTPYVAKLTLMQNDGTISDVINMDPLQTGQPWVRRFISSVSSKYKNSGIFGDDFDLASNISRRPALLSGGWYNGPPTSSNGLKVIEILANHKNCSPLDISLTCGDYIKLYNSSNHDVNLADYRLRVGYKGQNPSISNTFTWGKEIDPSQEELILPAGQYFTLITRNDNAPVSVPDDGDFIWLEDAYGQKIYSPVIEYPSATSVTKIGYAWAFNGKNWQWTSTPQPNAPNFFLLPKPEKSTSTNALKPCDPDQFRNPATNRCKLKSSRGSDLKPCDPDQFRNPATNRCKSKTGASDSLKPCKPTQFRNPATNRCKSKTNSSSLKPCRPDQKRNPQTNRCRKVGQVAGAAVQKIQNVPQTTGVSWWLAGVAGAGAVGYGVYEWRSEIITGIQRLRQFIKTK